MHIYQLLPYVLSTSFSTHPKRLTWDKKPFQSRRVDFFRHYETFLLFSALWDCFFPKFSFLFLINFWYLPQNGCSKNPQASPLLHFSALCDLPETRKISKKIRNFFSQFLVFWELFLSPVVEKVVFVFESFWALDMAPTWAVPGLLILNNEVNADCILKEKYYLAP